MTFPTLRDQGASVVVHPLTGELVSLDSPNPDLAAWLDGVRDLESRFREAKRQVHDELLARMDGAASWTIDTGDYKLVGESPALTEYDGDRLRHVLEQLVADGSIGEEAAKAALETVVTYKPRVRGIRALEKLGGVVREAIAACSRPVERPRRVSVRRS